MIEVNEEKKQKYINAVNLFHPEAILIDRHTPKNYKSIAVEPESPSLAKAVIGPNGKLIAINPPQRKKLWTPDTVREREIRSAMWGKVLKIADTPLFDEARLTLRNILKEYTDKGKPIWVSFIATNPVSGGLRDFPRMQRIGIVDIMDWLVHEDFEELVNDNDTDYDKAQTKVG